METTLRKQLPPWVPGWEDIRDEKVRERALEAQIELVRLEADGKRLEARQQHVSQEIERMNESEAGARAHRALARWWQGMFGLAVVIAILSAWWSLGWYVSLTWERALIALSLVVLPLVGWATVLLVFQERASHHLWRVVLSLGLVVVLASTVSVALLASGRMAGTALEEDRQQAVLRSSEDLTSPTESSPPAEVNRVKRLLAVTAVLAVMLLGVAGEIAAGVAFDRYLKHMTVVRTVGRFFREWDELAERMVANLHQQEEVRRWPERLHARLTAAGLEREAARAERSAAEAREAQRHREQAERRANSVGRVVAWVIGVFVAALALLAFLAPRVFAEESAVTVVIVDRSSSTTASEFSANLRAVEGIIQRTAAGSRLVVLEISAAGFNAPPLLTETAPQVAGRFGEYLKAWEQQATRKWRAVAAELRPVARGSDIFGAISRAAIEFANTPSSARAIIVLSDMRHVGAGFNFERTLGDPRILAAEAGRKGLIPRLEGVRVWVLGVHTVGLGPDRWSRLELFWQEYFKRAAAELKAFGPNRRLIALGRGTPYGPVREDSSLPALRPNPGLHRCAAHHSCRPAAVAHGLEKREAEIPSLRRREGGERLQATLIALDQGTGEVAASSRRFPTKPEI